MPPHNPRKFKRRKLWLVVPEKNINEWPVTDLRETREAAVEEKLDLMADIPETRWKVIAVWVDIVGANKGKQKGEE